MSGERVGEVTQALIQPSSLNIPVASTFNHETSVAYVSGAGEPASGLVAQGRWVAVSSNYDAFDSNTHWSWAYSADGTGSSWTFANQTSGAQFGCPGGTCPSASPSGHGDFTGWGSDGFGPFYRCGDQFQLEQQR